MHQIHEIQEHSKAMKESKMMQMARQQELTLLKEENNARPHGKDLGMPIHSRIPFITAKDVPLQCHQCCSEVCVHSTAYAAQHILS